MRVTRVFMNERRYLLECHHVNAVPEGLSGMQLPRVGQSWPCSRCTKREADFDGPRGSGPIKIRGKVQCKTQMEETRGEGK